MVRFRTNARKTDKVETTITPDLLFQAHSSLLDLVFYEADQFPSEYKGSLFVALKGSWNLALHAQGTRSYAARIRFALDSPLEGDGFEPSVPALSSCPLEAAMPERPLRGPFRSHGTDFEPRLLPLRVTRRSAIITSRY
jgi:hypothetical protein